MTSAVEMPSQLADRAILEETLERVVDARAAGGSGRVAEAMEYAVMGRGQRLRPLLALRVGRLAGADPRLTLRGAVAVELLHCASLIVDDLPCMDDEHTRRGRPTVHRRFGEATALLASFGLVALAARHVTESAGTGAQLRELTCFQQKLLRVLDCNALIGGQALDLSEQGASSRRLAELKTAPLFGIAARAGLLGAALPAFERRQLREFGHEFGVCYQLMDDWRDGHADSPAPFDRQAAHTRALLAPFGSRAAALEEMVDALAIHARA